MKLSYPIVIYVILALYLNLISLFSELGVDAGACLTGSQAILNGKIMYLDFIDHKPPGIYYLFALFLEFWNSVWMIKFSLIIFNMGSSCIVYLIAKKLWDKYTGMIAGIFYITGLIVYNGYIVIIEPYMSFFILSAILVYINFRESKELKYLFLSGILVGIATLIKQPALFILFGLILNTKIRNSFYLLLGFLIPIISTISYFYLNGSMLNLIYSIFYLNADFYKLSGIGMFLYYNILSNFTVFPLLWVLTLYGITMYSNNNIKLLATLLIFSFVPVLIGHGATYYIGILPFASLIATYSIKCLSATINEKQQRFAIILVLFMSLSVLAQIGIQVVYINSRNINDEIEIAGYISSNTNKNESIFIMPADAEYYFLSDRYPMGKNYWLLPISKNKTWTQESIIRELEVTKLRYIIVRNRPGVDEIMSEIYTYIDKNYQVDKVFIKKNVITGYNLSEVFIYKRNL